MAEGMGLAATEASEVLEMPEWVMASMVEVAPELAVAADSAPAIEVATDLAVG